MKQFTFDDKDAFIAKLRELTSTGTPVQRIQVVTSFPVHEALHILHLPASPLKYFTLTGAATGFCAGFGLTLYTVWHWPLITSGKPIFSLPPFTIIAFELTILLGAIASLLGFLHLNRLPSIPDILKPEETGNKFVIYVKE
jgi:hypothetical protein